MGFMRSTDQADLMTNLARNVRDPQGRLLGFYFPATGVIRTQEGQSWQVNEENVVRFGALWIGRFDPVQDIIIFTKRRTH